MFILLRARPSSLPRLFLIVWSLSLRQRPYTRCRFVVCWCCSNPVRYGEFSSPHTEVSRSAAPALKISLSAVRVTHWDICRTSRCVSTLLCLVTHVCVREDPLGVGGSAGGFYLFSFYRISDLTGKMIYSCTAGRIPTRQGPCNDLTVLCTAVHNRMASQCVCDSVSD